MRIEALASCLVVAALLGGTRSAFAGPETVTVTILHTNDLSGDLKGAASRAALIRQILARGNAIALDAGSGLSPDPFSAYDRGATMVEAVDTRADLLGASRVLEQATTDPYVFLREAYLQKRRSLVYDGSPPREKYEED